MMTKSELIALAKKFAVIHGLSPALVCAIVEQESAWDSYALRSESESGFMTRYGSAYNVLVRNSATKLDDKWIKFEDIFYSSYGLMQTMYPVIIETFPEQAAILKFPTILCDPEIGLNLGCRLFARKLLGAANSQTKALLNWNGGGNPNYPTEVLGRIYSYN